MRALYKIFVVISLLVLSGVSIPPAQAQTAPVYAPEQFQQLVAPIALYPDDLLGQVLMASAYPLEVVEAARWLAKNPGLSGDALTAALNAQPWDPSVKALAAFPQVLSMMNDNLEWTEKLGEAFMADQGGMMDAVQQLRARAQSADRLPPPSQLSVATDNGYITIAPAQPDNVYVPWYNPSTVFAPWPDANYSPYYFPTPYASYCYYSACWYSFAPAVPVYYSWWGWDHISWRHHHVHIDTHKWRALTSQPAPAAGTWAFDPSHRHGVPLTSPELRQRFQKIPPSAVRENRGFGMPETQSAPGAQNVQPSRRTETSAPSWQEATGGHRPPPQPAADQRAAQVEGVQQTQDQSAAREQRHQLHAQQRQMQQQAIIESERRAAETPVAPAPVAAAVPQISFHGGGQPEGRMSRGGMPSPRIEPQRSTPPLFETMPTANTITNAITMHGHDGGGGNGFGGGHERAPPTPNVRAPEPTPTPARTPDNVEQGGDRHGH